MGYQSLLLFLLLALQLQLAFVPLLFQFVHPVEDHLGGLRRLQSLYPVRGFQHSQHLLRAAFIRHLRLLGQGLSDKFCPELRSFLYELQPLLHLF